MLFWTKWILPLIFRFLTVPGLVCLEVYALIIGWLRALSKKLRWGHLMRSEASNVGVIKVRRRGWHCWGKEVRHIRHRVWIVCFIIETHHLIIMHVVHILKISLIMLISPTTRVTVMLVPFSGPIPTFFSHLIFSPTLIPSKICLSLSLSSLFRVLSLRCRFNLLVWRVVHFLKTFSYTFWLHAFDIIVFEDFWCSFNVEESST